MAVQAKTASLHFSRTFHFPSPMPTSQSLLFGPLRSMSMASKPQRIRKALELTCKSNPNDNQQVWLGFHCSLTTFVFFFFLFFILTQKLNNPSSLIGLVPWLCFRIIWLMLLSQLEMAFPSVEVLFCSLSNTHLLVLLCGLNSLNFSPLVSLVYEI